MPHALASLKVIFNGTIDATHLAPATCHTAVHLMQDVAVSILIITASCVGMLYPAAVPRFIFIASNVFPAAATLLLVANPIPNAYFTGYSQSSSGLTNSTAKTMAAAASCPLKTIRTLTGFSNGQHELTVNELP